TPGGNMEGPAICFFSIPLITIVAMFVLNLFLPIVVFVFQLWFMLVLRFCIKPQISASGGLDAALAVQPPGIDLDLDLGITLGGVNYTPASLHGALKSSLSAQIQAELGELAAGDVGSSLDKLSNNALGNHAQSNHDNATMPVDPAQPPPEVAY